MKMEELILLLIGVAIGCVLTAVFMSRQYPRIDVVPGGAFVTYHQEWRYRVNDGETCTGIMPGDPTNCARIITREGIVRFQLPEPRKQ